jgi:hypothetical protein
VVPPPLLPCPACDRYVRRRHTRCLFCGAALAAAVGATSCSEQGGDAADTGAVSEAASDATADAPHDVSSPGEAHEGGGG